MLFSWYCGYDVVRVVIIISFIFICFVSSNSIAQPKAIVADLHNASLLIDDIEDNSKLRRGQPVAHSIFGVASVINTANYVYFMALERCFLLGSEGAMKVRVVDGC